ncbi:MAG: PaaI family thioesterase, partial [Vicinamibacteria bacterium]
ITTKASGNVPTIDLRVDYLRPARKGDLVAIGRTVKVGRTIGVADVEVRDSNGALIAVGRGTYAIPKA